MRHLLEGRTKAMKWNSVFEVINGLRKRKRKSQDETFQKDFLNGLRKRKRKSQDETFQKDFLKHYRLGQLINHIMTS